VGAGPERPIEEPRRRRSRLRRGARLLLLFLLFLTVPLAAGLILLHLPIGRAAVKTFVERAAGHAAGGRLTLGGLDYSLPGGRLDVAALELRAEGLRVTVQEAHLSLGLRSGVHLEVVRPVVVWRDSGKAKPKQTATGLAARPWAILEELAQADLVDGRVELQSEKGVPYLVLADLDARLRAEGARRTVALTLGEGSLSFGKRSRLAPVRGDGRLAVDHGTLVVDELHLSGGDSSLDIHGSLTRLSPEEGTLTARAVLDATLLRALAPGTDLAGRVGASGDVRLAGGDVAGTLQVETTPSLTWAGLGPLSGKARGRYDLRQLTVESLDLEGFSGRLHAEGPLAMDGTSPTDVSLHAEGLDVRALARAASHADVKVRSRLSGSVRWTTRGFDVGRGRATGSLALAPEASASLRAGGPPGVPLAGSAAVVIEGRTLRLEDVLLEAHGARIAGAVGLASGLALDGRFEAHLPLDAASAFATDLGAAKPPDLVGSVAAEGVVHGDAKDPVATLRVVGTGLAPAVHAQEGALSLEADARYEAGRLAVARATVRAGEGQADFVGGLPLTPAGGRWDLTGEMRAIDLGMALAVAGVEGRGSLSGRVRVDGPLGAPRAESDVEARLVLAGDPEPLVATASGSFADGRVRLSKLEADVAGGHIEGKGEYDTSTRALAAQGTASGLRLARLPMLPRPMAGIDGELSAAIDLSGTPEAPAGEARARLVDAKREGKALPGLAVAATSDGRRLELTGSAETGGSEAVVLRGEGSLTGDWPLHLEADLAKVPAQAVLDAFASEALDEATIEARGRIVVDLPARTPRQFRYRGEGLAAEGRVRHLEWSTEPFGLEGTVSEARLSGLRLTTAAVSSAAEAERDRAEGETAPPARGTLAVDGRLPLGGEGTFDLTVTGDLALAAGDAVVPDSRLGGQASLAARVGGTMSSPVLDGTFGVVDGRGRFEGARVRAVEVSGRFAGREAVVDGASAHVLGGRFAASGSLPLAALEDGRVARLHFEAEDVDLARLAVPYAERSADSPAFFVSLSGDLEAEAPRLDLVRVAGQITRLESKTSEGTTALAAPAAWHLAAGRLVLDPIRLSGPLGALEANGEATFLGAPRGVLSLTGPFDLRLVGPFVPSTVLSGAARVDLRARWGDGPTRLEGKLAVEDGRATLEELAFTASRIKGEVRFLGDRAELDASAAAGDGTMVAYGGMSFVPALLGPAAFSIEAERVPIAYPEGFRGRATGGLLVEGDAGRYRISGLVDVTQAYYTAEFDGRGQSLDRLEYQIAALDSQDSIADHLPLAVDVRLKDPLRVRNKTARLDVVGVVTVNGTLAQPVASGQVSLLSGGELTVRRARVRVQQGRLELNDYPSGTPDVDFSGLTQVGGVTMSLSAEGAMDDLQIDVTSPNRPDLSQADLLSLILTGRTAQAAASEGGTIVAEELAAALGGALQKSVGDTVLVDVSSDESMLLDEGDPTQRFRVGTRLPHNVSVIYSTRLDGTEQRWAGRWSPRGGRFALSFIDDREEGQAVEVSDRRSFNVLPRPAAEKPSGNDLARLDALRFEGRLPLPEDDLRKAAGLRIGQRYDPLRLAQAADKVRAALVEAGWRGASVEEGDDPGAARKGHIELVLKVDAGPRIELTWTGDDPGEKARERALASWPPYASPETAATLVARTVRVDLQAHGFYEAKVDHEVRAKEGTAEVVLSVGRGPKGTGVDVHFEGNRALSQERLVATLPKPGSREFFDDLDRRARLFAQARIAYAGLGYLRPRLTTPSTRFDAASGRLAVTVRVREGAPAVVGKVTLPAEVTQAGASGPALRLREGLPFDVGAYVADRDAIAAWYRREGWTEARVAGALEPSGRTVGITYAADAGPRPRLREVRIASTGRTHEAMVRRALKVEPGATILPQQLAETRTRLSDLGTFSTVDLRTVPVEGHDDLRDLEVRYFERPDVEFEYGLRYQLSSTAPDTPTGPTEGPLQVAAAVTLANPFGWGWRLSGFTLQTTSRHNYRAGFESSTLFGLRVKSQLLYFDETYDESAIAASFASKVRGFTVQQSRTLVRANRGQRWHDMLRLQWGYTKKYIEYSEEVGSPVLVSGNRAFLSLSLIGDWRDSLTDPHRGVFWTATTECARQLLGSDVNYNRFYGQIFTYLPLAGGLVWAQGYRGGVVPGEDPFDLLDNRFQSGGPTTVRGFRQNGLGPQFDENEGFGGQGVFVFNQELRFPIWKRLHGAAFWDAGNTWLLANEFSLRDLRHTVGAGLRIMFPFGPIRLEYGFILDRRKNSDGSYVEPLGRFVFGLGHAF
jgi:outer membrane protein assembly complex protein YaeT